MAGPGQTNGGSITSGNTNTGSPGFYAPQTTISEGLDTIGAIAADRDPRP